MGLFKKETCNLRHPMDLGNPIFTFCASYVHSHLCMHHMHTYIFIFRKRVLSLVAIFRKETCNLRHPTGLRHPVRIFTCYASNVYFHLCIHHMYIFLRIFFIFFGNCKNLVHILCKERLVGSLNCRSLWQNIVTFTGLSCKRDL